MYSRSTIKDVSSFPSPTQTVMVADYATLISTYPATSYTNQLIWVAASSGIYFINYHPSGWYISNGTTWVPASAPESDAAGVSADTTGFSHSSSSTVQAVLSDFDTAIGAGGGGTTIDVFAATLTADQSIATVSEAVVTFDSVSIDTQTAWNGTTHRWTPTVAGTYEIHMQGMLSSMAAGKGFGLRSYKNGALLVERQVNNIGTGTYNIPNDLQFAIAMNGTTDYLDFRAYNSDTVSRNLDHLYYRTHIFTSFLHS